MDEGRDQAAQATRPPSGPPVATMSFEAALEELERIVRTLEGGQGALAQAIELYARGNELRRHCEARLAEAEQKVQAIVDGAGGPTLRDVE